jgi:hypothetical protein
MARIAANSATAACTGSSTMPAVALACWQAEHHRELGRESSG